MSDEGEGNGDTTTATDRGGDGTLFTPGEQVDHFRVMRLLGKGGMGEVYLARDTKLGRKVALKVINPSHFRSTEAVERFIFEARTTARFNHPHIVTIYAVGEHRDRPYVALEYLEGQTLRERMEEQRLGAKEIARVGLAIAEALREAGRYKVLHQDLKPENVLLPRDGRLRVVDFGLATVVREAELEETLERLPLVQSAQILRLDEVNADATTLAPDKLSPTLKERDAIQPRQKTKPGLGTTETVAPGAAVDPDAAVAPGSPGAPGELVDVTLLPHDAPKLDSILCPPSSNGGIQGTPHYMSPEQWLQQPCSGATDIWALGLILFELAAGRRPFPGQTLAELAAQVTGSMPVSVAELDQIPQPLAELILACLSREPADRPTAEEVARALERLLATGRRDTSGEQSPFRGLMPFGEQHADYFFGRESEVSSFVERLREEPVLPVVGPSGAGKSSMVQAGVVPRLREQGPWVVLKLRPGAEPVRTLAARLLLGQGTWSGQNDGKSDSLAPSRAGARSELDLGGHSASRPRSETLTEEQQLVEQLLAQPSLLGLKLLELAERSQSRVLLFVDQLEEIYTLVSQAEQRDVFLRALCTAADDPQDPVRVVFTVREDFLGRLSRDAQMREVLGRVTVISSPGPEALEETLTRPLEAVGYGFDEPGLAREMVQAVGAEPACLSLLQFAGRMLWERRDRHKRLLTRQAHDAMGGVAGALARHADGVLEGLASGQMSLTRELMLRMVTAEGTRKVVTRRRLLEDLDPAARDVLARLIQGRLITARKRPTQDEGAVEVELAHESLVRTWNRLARWIDESRDELVALGEMSQAAELWHRRGERAEEVWQGKALHEALRTLERLSAKVPADVRRFISIGAQREQRRIRRRRLLIAALIVVPTVVALLFIAKEREATHGKEEAQAQRTRAEQQRRQARRRWAEAQREGARAALAQEDLIAARAKLRGSLELQDALPARVLWWRIARHPLLWRKELSNGIYDVAFSPDGQTLAAAGQDRTVHLFKIKTRATRQLRGHADQVFSVAFSPDGRRLASSSWDKTIRIWDLGSGRTLRVLRGHSHSVRAICYLGASRLASVGGDRIVRIWDLRRGASTRELKGHTQTIYGVACSPDGRIVASAGRDGVLKLWDTRTGALRQTLSQHSGPVEGVAFSPDGATLASASWDDTVRLWDARTGAQKRTLRGHGNNAVAVEFAPDGRSLISASWDKTVRIWDLRSGATTRVLSGHGGGLYGAAISPDGTLVASGSWDKGIRVWHTDPRRGIPAAAGHTGAVYGLAFDREGGRIASGSLDKTVRIWDVRTGAQTRVLRGHTNAVEGVSFAGDGKTLASGGSDTTIRLWDVVTGIQQRMLVGHTAEITGLTFGPNGTLLASASLDTKVRLWDARSGALLRLLEGHKAGVRSVDFSPDGKLLVSGGHDRTARLWVMPSGRPRGVFSDHKNSVFGVAFTPDGRSLATGGGDGQVRLRDLRRGTSRLLGRHPGRVYIIDVHPEGSWVGAPSSVGSAMLWSTKAQGAPVAPVALIGHRAEVNYLRFSPDGKLVASSSDDGTVRLWRTADGSPYWRAPVLVPGPPRLLTHLGWRRFDAAGEPRPAKAGAGWQRAVERARLGSTSADGKHLCLMVRQTLERWDLVGDWRSSSRVVKGRVKQLLATPKGCVVLSTRPGKPTRAWLHRDKGAPLALGQQASAMAWSAGEVLVAGEAGVRSYAPDGRPGPSLHGGSTGISAVQRVGHLLVLGFSNGSIELIASSGRPLPLPFVKTASSPVVALREGPSGTLIAGFASGLVGLWYLKNGDQLYAAQLHGSVQHLLLENQRLYAATDLGQHLVLDLSLLRLPYCELLRRVWQEVPVIWEDGLPVLHPPPEDHACQR